MKVSSSVELAWIGGAGLGSFLPPRMARYPRRKVPPRVAMESYIYGSTTVHWGVGSGRKGGLNRGGGGRKTEKRDDDVVAFL